MGAEGNHSSLGSDATKLVKDKGWRVYYGQWQFDRTLIDKLTEISG
ncbi:hypothetical protein [Capnocytophaga catalasegens]|uniref:Uncharacterized protein n=1 Tax=Capnocytophaga catalasegens TaxID=1004260 RepID=A0AAV5AX39_9FLAO|nr:hypothetical protein [Capnocytophaga catalasegens]GIZ15553.1 hypothetical protein RCZ03_15530 [Capnocytophaga catalasegens]GJM49896.1 hypothetical protein RCZ15_08710 [Capnocytophaga catalasegens]GJM54068.1 hypothetical protein RCZ16_23840 [Capnocytophaga catalasegens]